MSYVVQLAWPFVALCALAAVVWFLKMPVSSRRQLSMEKTLTLLDVQIAALESKVGAVEKLQSDLQELQRKVDRNELGKLGRTG